MSESSFATRTALHWLPYEDNDHGTRGRISIGLYSLDWIFNWSMELECECGNDRTD